MGVIIIWWYNSRTVNEIDTFHQSNVLPYFCLSWDGRHCAHFLLAKGIDNGRFPGVGISNKPYRYLLTIRMKGRKLTEKLNERSFAKGVGDGCMECKGWIVL